MTRTFGGGRKVELLYGEHAPCRQKKERTSVTSCCCSYCTLCPVLLLPATSSRQKGVDDMEPEKGDPGCGIRLKNSGLQIFVGYSRYSRPV